MKQVTTVSCWLIRKSFTYRWLRNAQPLLLTMWQVTRNSRKHNSFDRTGRNITFYTSISQTYSWHYPFFNHQVTLLRGRDHVFRHSWMAGGAPSRWAVCPGPPAARCSGRSGRSPGTPCGQSCENGELSGATRIQDTSTGSQCCGAGAGEAVIKLSPRAGAEITNYGSGSLLFFIKDLKKFYRKKSWLHQLTWESMYVDTRVKWNRKKHFTAPQHCQHHRQIHIESISTSKVVVPHCGSGSRDLMTKNCKILLGRFRPPIWICIPNANPDPGPTDQNQCG